MDGWVGNPSCGYHSICNRSIRCIVVGTNGNRSLPRDRSSLDICKGLKAIRTADQLITMRRKKTERNHVPDSWKIVRLGDVADIAFSGVDKKTVEGEVPVELCNYTDVFYNRRIRVGMKLMTATATPVERDTWSLKKGDVLFTKDSETSDEIGVPSYVSDDMPNVLCGYHLGLARPSSDLAYGAFLARSLASRVSAQEFSRIANGVTRFGLTLDATRNLPILLPPLPEQWAIAAVLDSIDDAIERTEAVIAATERLRSALLHELLTRGVPGWHTAWKEAHGIGTVPASWDVVRLGDVCDVAFSSVDKKTVVSEVPVELCNYTDVFYNRRIRSGMSFMAATASPDECDRWALRKGDVLFTKDSETPDEIGIPAYVTVDMPKVLCGYHLGLARSRAEIAEGAYLAELLRSPRTAGQFARIANGVTRFGLTLGATNSLMIPLPPLSEQRIIAAMLDAVDHAIERGHGEQDGLQSLKASAADALLTGLVRVRGQE